VNVNNGEYMNTAIQRTSSKRNIIMIMFVEKKQFSDPSLRSCPRSRPEPWRDCRGPELGAGEWCGRGLGIE